MPAFDEIVDSPGFLTDTNIISALQQDYLVEKGTADIGQVRHASYTLRLGDRVEVCAAVGSSHKSQRTLEVRRLNPDQPLELQPGDMALLYSAENLRLPPNVMGFTVARGLLFAESLTPENTYVDPGFSGFLYTTVTNISGRIVRLNYQMPITRLFFYKLHDPVGQPYRSGAAKNIAQQLETVPVIDVGPEANYGAANRTTLISTITKLPLAGIAISEIFRRDETNFFRLFLLSALWPILLVAANSNAWIRTHLGTFVANVLASVVAAILILGIPWLYRKVVG